MSALETSGMAGGHFSLDKIKFTYGSGMQKQWVESKNNFVDHAGARFGPSAVASIEDEELMTTEVDQSVLPMHTTEETEETYVASLNHWEKKTCKQAEDDHFKFSRITRQHQATSYGIVLGLYDDSLKSRLGAEVGFQNMIRNKGFCVMKSHHLMKKM